MNNHKPTIVESKEYIDENDNPVFTVGQSFILDNIDEHFGKLKNSLVLAICLQKFRQIEIKRIIRLNSIIKTLILCRLHKSIPMDILSLSGGSKFATVIKCLKIQGWSDLDVVKFSK